MHSRAAAEALSAVALALVLAWAVRRPRDWPEAAVAVPAAALLVAVGAVTPAAALAEARRLGPVVGFLGCVLVLAKLCDDDGVFRYLGTWLARGRPGQAGRDGHGEAVRLLGRVFVVASVITAVLSLDATVVLLTPVVLIAARRSGLRARPCAYACGHLANSASLLLPVSNLTNLLAFTVSGLSFGKFAALMALPWLAAIGTEYVVLRWHFRADLRAASPGPGGTPGSDPAADGEGGGAAPVFALVVVAVTLAGFVVASAAGANPAWAALGGALILAVRALAKGETSPASIGRSADVPFLLFVVALGVVVTAVADNGLAAGLRPAVGSGTSLPALLAVAALSAGLAALVNNLPAVLVLLPLAAPSGAGAVLAVLIGVNIGPNLTYTGSLATLLWRRVLRGYDADVTLGEFTATGLRTVPPAIFLSVVALWLGLRAIGG
jgi:arsenical pump membrane protein